MSRLSNRGGIDNTKSLQKYSASNIWGFPDMLEQQTDPTKETYTIKPYRSRYIRKKKDVCHFFLDDHRLEPIWSRESVASKSIKKYKAVMTPDFSIYTDWTRAVNIYQTYRNRWMMRHWQEMGIEVIPTVNWTDKSSFDFCFTSILTNQVISLSIADFRSETTKTNYLLGLEQMQRQLRPKKIICYGETDLDKYLDCPIDYHETDWVKMRKKLEKSKKQKKTI